MANKIKQKCFNMFTLKPAKETKVNTKQAHQILLAIMNRYLGKIRHLSKTDAHRRYIDRNSITDAINVSLYG